MLARRFLLNSEMSICLLCRAAWRPVAGGGVFVADRGHWSWTVAKGGESKAQVQTWWWPSEEATGESPMVGAAAKENEQAEEAALEEETLLRVTCLLKDLCRKHVK